MELFNLPPTTIVNKIIPKNSFDAYATPKQRKMFTDLVQRITWTNKISMETTNLPGKDIKEIQIFKVDLKAHQSIDSLLLVIDKAIPYPIISVVSFDQQMYFYTSVKHPHPVNEDNAVVDWTFRSDWCQINHNPFSISLKTSLDAVYLDICLKISGESIKKIKTLNELVDRSRSIEVLSREVARLKAAIANCKQFNQKVELNVNLKALEKKLDILLTSSKRNLA